MEGAASGEAAQAAAVRRLQMTSVRRWAGMLKLQGRRGGEGWGGAAV